MSLHPSSPLFLVFRIGTALCNPRELLNCFKVSREWNNTLKRDEFWQHYKNVLLSKLPCLAPLFETGPIWKTFVQHVWRYKTVAELSETFHTLPSLIVLAIIVAGHLKPHDIKVVEQLQKTINVTYNSGGWTNILLHTQEITYNELVRNKRRKRIEYVCNVLLCNKDGTRCAGDIYHPNRLFGPYMDIIFFRKHVCFRNGAGRPIKKTRENSIFWGK